MFNTTVSILSIHRKTYRFSQKAEHILPQIPVLSLHCKGNFSTYYNYYETNDLFVSKEQQNKNSLTIKILKCFPS